MYISPTIRTANGLRLASEQRLVDARLNAQELDLLVSAIRRQAEDALAAGNVEAFDRLHSRATALGEASRLSAVPFRDIAPRHDIAWGRSL